RVTVPVVLPEAATRRDLDDPVTIKAVADAVGDRRTLDLLHALTESDALATGPAAWSEWKAGLIDDLVARTRASLAGESVPDEPQVALVHAALVEAPGLQLRLTAGEASTQVIVAADDRPGLLADIAGVLALNRLEVRSADTQTVGDRAVSAWVVHPLYGEPPVEEALRQDLQRAVDGTLDVAARLAARHQPPRGPSAPARVDFVTGAASAAEVLEVRAHDQPGLLCRVSAAVTSAGAFITAARAATLGSEVIDVFYVRRPDGSRIDTVDRARIVSTVLEALAPASH
ncbi:MAG: ACT domain-containing protein, partial [Actinomycetota bacterium]